MTMMILYSGIVIKNLILHGTNNHVTTGSFSGAEIESN